ncbi:hypothetical protein WN55_04612 [Dufourea novaeangliae]|uniref:Uncharacterized protein n=1 Tax=Dufourea novaeangliae TaxID=178035 RepID=A0A154P1H3_DUFNO|nr:hypothetical protein WN55_04612 [Dufourea novaeangliae]
MAPERCNTSNISITGTIKNAIDSLTSCLNDKASRDHYLKTPSFHCTNTSNLFTASRIRNEDTALSASSSIPR